MTLFAFAHFPFIFFPHFVGMGLLMYFLPTIIAVVRNKRDFGAIFVLNLLLGWSVIGWIIALVWALKQDYAVMMR